MTSNELFRTPARLRVTALAALLALALAPTGPASVAPELPDVASELPDVAVQETSPGAPADAVGSGFPIGLGRLGCLGCAGMYIGMGWGSVVGTFLAMAGWPEYVVLCGLACLKAFGD